MLLSLMFYWLTLQKAPHTSVIYDPCKVLLESFCTNVYVLTHEPLGKRIHPASDWSRGLHLKMSSAWRVIEADLKSIASFSTSQASCELIVITQSRAVSGWKL